MNKWIQRIALACATLVGVGLAAAGEDLETIQKKLHAAWEKQKGMTAKIAIATHVEMGAMVMDGKGDGSYEFARQGDKVCCRLELKNTMTQKTGESENKVEQSVLNISDGEFAYTLSEGMGGKNAMKSKIDAKVTGEPKALFEELGQTYEFKVLPDETVDGLKTYVLEATPKKAGPMGTGRVLLYFHQDSGFVVKQIVHGADDKPMQTMTYSDVKLDAKVDPERFKFKAPEGVEVRDMTTSETPAPGKQAGKDE